MHTKSDTMPTTSAAQRQALPQRAKLTLTANALKVLAARYLVKDEKGKVTERPEDLFDRVARIVSDVETRYGGDPDYWRVQFYNVMARREFMPNSPTLMNAGRSMGMLSACFVLPVEDSIDDIFNSIKHTAMIQKAGGGTGFDFSRLRPAGDRVSSSGGQTSGPLSFLKVFSEATNAIQQGAFRRGANMGMMRIDHPDIIDFIRIKEDLRLLTNYNLSVSMTDEFMRDLKSHPGKVHEVVNPRNQERFPLAKKDKPGEFWTKGEIFDLIVQKAWKSGEPGVIFIDEVNRRNPTPHIGRMEATNPCGEQPLLPYEACNLGSIHLALFVRTGAEQPEFDWAAFRECIGVSTRFLDNVIDANQYPLPEITRVCQANRKIGLGVMGFADALFKLRIPYDSEAGVAFGEEIMRFLNDESHAVSEALAGERGVFPNWKGSTWDTEHHRPMRNACVTTVAPTGTISIIANCSSGIEPLFSVAFFRNVLNGQRLTEVNDEFVAAFKAAGAYDDALIDRAATEGTIQHIDAIPAELRRIFVCAHDIQPEWHIRMQAAFQRHCDAAISKTINFAHDATAEDVRQIYLMAFDSACKGVTVYRDGCRAEQPMALDNAKAQAADAPAGPLQPVKLPDIMPSIRIRQKTPFGNMHVKITVDPASGTEREVFAQLGKGGDVANSDLEAVCRMVSLFLRCNGTLDLVIEQLEGIGSSLSIASRDGRVLSLGDGLALCLKKYLAAKRKHGLKAMLLGEVKSLDLDDDAKPAVVESAKSHGNGSAALFKIKCPECQTVLHFEEGCVKCHGCGFSQC